MKIINNIVLLIRRKIDIFDYDFYEHNGEEKSLISPSNTNEVSQVNVKIDFNFLFLILKIKVCQYII